ncbi:MAG: HNH endonuclease domain-containing protein [Chitinophagales bacterium]
MKKILGIDLGTNSIGWALVEIDHEKGVVKIIALGSRILPMDAGEVKDFESKGKIQSSASQRTENRRARRMNERFILRRDRLHLVLNLLNALPKHYKLEIDFANAKGEKCGHFKANKEPKLAYLSKYKDQKAEFLFKESYQEMLNELGIGNKKHSRIPYDWTLYYLRQKALKSEITLEELAWVLLSYNQKRGYEKNEVEDDFDELSKKLEEFGLTKTTQAAININKIEIESLSLKVINTVKDKNSLGEFYRIELDNGYSYNEYSNKVLTEVDNDIDEVKIIERLTILNDEGNYIDTNKTIYKIEDIFNLTVREVVQKEKDKYIKFYTNGWQTETKYNDFKKFKTKGEFEEDIFVTRLYNEKGEIIIPSKKNDELILKKSDNPFVDFKLLDPNKASNWKLIKKKVEKDALKFNSQNGLIDEKDGKRIIKKYISPQIYNTLKKDALSGNRTKIIGGMFQVVDRDFYREELNQIIETQKQFHNELKSKELFEQCTNALYPKNESHAKALLTNKTAIQHLLVEDILLYQRPLKSKKPEIADCKHEIQRWVDVLKKDGSPIEEIDKETGEIKLKKQPVYLKVVSTSHPIFQEFRIWDKLHNLRLIQIEKEINGKIETNVDITEDYFTPDTYEKLFELLNNHKTLSQSKLIEFLKPKFKEKKEDYKNFVWNFPEDEEFKGNETRVSFAIRFKRCGFTDYAEFLTQKKELDLWHYLYSVNYKERTANNNKSATTFFNGFLKVSDDNPVVADDVKEKIIKDFANYPKFVSKYCAYSEKALKKLLPLMRLSNKKTTDFWTTEQGYAKWQQSLEERKEEILKRKTEIDFKQDDIDWGKHTDNFAKVPFPKGLFNAFESFEKIEDFTKLNLTQASYLVYGRHSELAQAIHWNSPQEIRKNLHHELKQHSLNNPVAEKVILEMMQIVAKIWETYGEKEEETDDYKKLFDKIHLEVGRELKKSAKEKETISKNQSANKSQNKRLRQVLEEFLSKAPYNAIPQNNDHFERLKIVEEGAEHTKNMNRKFFEENEKIKKAKITKKDIEDILKKPQITKEDFDKYKLWIEQGYRSPYTGLTIKLSDLFDGNKYNIDHVFPQASVTNDSLSNKVVCELEINKLKSDKTGREFISVYGEKEIYCSAHNSKVKINNDNEYVDTVKTQFSGPKRFILLSKEIPKGFTNSQLNNMRHIARKAMELLSHIVREEGEVEFRSKNVLPVTGEITSKLKKTWRLDQVWKELVAPRFIRMNELTQSDLFGQWQTSKQGQKYFDCKLDDTIIEKDESFDIKRIDHRHHALDALIVALCTEEHVNYINNINADAKSDKYGKQKKIEKYRETLKRKIMFSQPNKEDPKEKDWFYMLPGEIRKQDAETSSRETVFEKTYFYKELDSFGQDYKAMILTALQHTVVTFKQNLRVINKTVNRYKNSPNTVVKQNTDNGQKPNWAIRRSLGKGTYYGKIDIGERENRQLLKNIDFFYNNIDTIVDKSLKQQIQEIKDKSLSEEDFKNKLKEKFKNITIKCIAYKAASRYNSNLETFSSNKITSITDKINSISDKGIREILFNHLKQFDTVELSFEEALQYYDAVLEKQELQAIITDSETNFKSIQDFATFLQSNKYTYKKVDYSKLNVFIEQVSKRDFRNEEKFKNSVIQHHEIAFSPEEIEKMNKPENLKRLNNGKNHKPIRKVRTYTGFGNEKRISSNVFSNKYNQFVKMDKGANLYIAIYEIEDKSKVSRSSPIRIFKEISLFDLIEFQKSANTFDLPIEERICNEVGEAYKFLFTLTQNDCIKFTSNDKEYFYAFNRFTGGDIYFRPINHAAEIYEAEVDLKINPKNKKLIGSQTNETTSINGEQIKNICWKLKVDRLGNISKW